MNTCNLFVNNSLLNLIKVVLIDYYNFQSRSSLFACFALDLFNRHTFIKAGHVVYKASSV